MMSMSKPFRFAVYGEGNSKAAWAGCARKVEDLGYSTLLVADHIGSGELAPLTALLAAADVTTRLRLGVHVMANDFRNPALLAHEAASLDVLSDGRLELGLGAGWEVGEYEAVGLAFESPGVRLSRLFEAVALIKRLYQEESVTHDGQHYRVQELSLQPKPVQNPYPPLYIGGGGRRIVEFAAREANIVGLAVKTTPDGKLDFETTTAAAVAEKVAWARHAADERSDDVELHIQLSVVFTDDQQQGAEDALQELGEMSPIAVNTGLSATDVLESPHFLIGTVEQMVDTLQERRERYGISYFTAFADAEKFSPVVARLADT